MGASCALRRYPQQPTGAGPPGAREESGPKTATADVSLPFCKKRIEKGKGVGGGSSATQEAVKTGVYETAPGKTRLSGFRIQALTNVLENVRISRLQAFLQSHGRDCRILTYCINIYHSIITMQIWPG